MLHYYHKRKLKKSQHLPLIKPQHTPIAYTSGSAHAPTSLSSEKLTNLKLPKTRGGLVTYLRKKAKTLQPPLEEVQKNLASPHYLKFTPTLYSYVLVELNNLYYRKLSD